MTQATRERSWSVACDPVFGGRPDPRVLAAAARMLADRPGATVHLAGPGELLDAALDVVDPAVRDAFVVHDAPGVLQPGEDDLVVRGRPTLPIRVALGLLADGTVDAVRSAAPVGVVLTAAVFQLGRDRARPGDELSRVVAGARPAVAMRLELAQGPLDVVDAGAHAAATPMDLVGRLVAAGRPGQRLGLLDPLGDGAVGVAEATELAARLGVQVRSVTVREAVTGAVDVVGCAGTTGKVLVESVQHTGGVAVGAARLVGVRGDVAHVDPDRVGPADLAPSAHAVGQGSAA